MNAHEMMYYDLYNFREKNVWWYCLAATHSYVVVMTLSRTAQAVGYIKSSFTQREKSEKHKMG